MTGTALRGKRILVTGGNGFLGGHLVPRLSEESGQPVARPRRSEFDLGDRDAAARMMRRYRPEVVVHLAARRGGTEEMLRDPGPSFRETMAMGLNVLEAAREEGVARLVLVGCSCAYPGGAEAPLREADLWCGPPGEMRPFCGIVRHSLLQLAGAYRRQYGCDFACVLPAEVYGPGAPFDRVRAGTVAAMVRDIVEAARAGKTVAFVAGTGGDGLDCLFVEDAAAGVIAAAERLRDPDPVNLGSGAEVSTADLTALVAREAGYRGEIRFDPTRPDDHPHGRLDTRRAEKLLGWRARVPLAEGIRRTVDWYRRRQPVPGARGPDGDE